MGSVLFSGLELRGVSLANRIVVSPMGQYSAVDGCATDWHLMHLGHLSISGAGLMITEATAVHPSARLSHQDLGLWSDENAAALDPVFAFCRKHGSAKIGMQLYHGGRKGSITTAWEGQRAIPPEKGGWTPTGASDIPYPGRNSPRSLTAQGIKEVIGWFAAAAQRADRLGVDVIEVHAAHGYLIHNFLSPKSNLRKDEYGGCLVGRMRFALEIFDAVRAVWPERKALGCEFPPPTGWTAAGRSMTVWNLVNVCGRGAVTL